MCSRQVVTLCPQDLQQDILTGTSISPEALICSIHSNDFISASSFKPYAPSGILLGRSCLCATTRLFLLIGSQREILETANAFLQPPPSNITANPRATRDSKIPTSRNRQLSLLLRNCAGNCGEHVCSTLCSGKTVLGGISKSLASTLAKSRLAMQNTQLFTFLV